MDETTRLRIAQLRATADDIGHRYSYELADELRWAAAKIEAGEALISTLRSRGLFLEALDHWEDVK